MFRVGARAAAGNGTHAECREKERQIKRYELIPVTGLAGVSIQSPFPRKAAVENRIHIFKESPLEPYIVPLLGKNRDPTLQNADVATQLSGAFRSVRNASASPR